MVFKSLVKPLTIKLPFKKLLGEGKVTEKEKLIFKMLEAIGEDPKREGLKETPTRVISSWLELYSGYSQDPKEILCKTFKRTHYQEMVICRDISFYSTCEHHMLPFFGKAHVGYIPNKKIVGLSKLPRLVSCFSRRLQIQESLTEQIAQAIETYLEPEGVGVWMKAQHLCVLSRGVRDHSSKMITTSLKGSFLEDHKVRQEFLSSLKL